MGVRVKDEKGKDSVNQVVVLIVCQDLFRVLILQP